MFNLISKYFILAGKWQQWCKKFLSLIPSWHTHSLPNPASSLVDTHTHCCWVCSCLFLCIYFCVCACWGRRTASRVFHGSVQLISNEFEMGPLTWDFPSRLGWPTRQQPLQCPRLLVFMFVPLATCTAVSTHWNIPGFLTWVLCVERRSSTKQSLPLFLCF